MYLTVVWVSCFIVSVEAHNLDSAHPLFYNIVKGNKKNNDYFGFSVAVRPKAAHLRDTWFIQIGAPRGKAKRGTVLKRSGSVYRCLTNGSCYSFQTENSFGESGGRGLGVYKGKEDDAWIGVSMNIKNYDGIERTVICGHRWINENLKNSENVDVTYLMTGLCYLQDLNNNATESDILKLLPLVSEDKIYTPRPYVPNLSTYHWGLGQGGISALLTEKPDGIILGAPGVTHWIGSVIHYRHDLLYSVGDFAKSEIPKNKRYTYLGYSVAAGKFYRDKEIWFASGAPRSANYRGEVFIFRFKASTDVVLVETVLAGKTFGEYFGSSLTTEDVNGDGYDDLMVGAPTFSRKQPDEGRIYVYLGNDKGNFLIESQIINGRISRGRFGQCMSSLKDLDQDGFNDVAVGAPYEDGSRGAVYIFKGFSRGLISTPSQRIYAREVNPHLRGFGISISGGVDVDGNKYKDVAVGSYLSEEVVLLRSRPIIFLHPHIKAENVSLLERQTSFFEMTFCSSYTGSNPPLTADVLQIINIDPVHRRAAIQTSRSSLVLKKIIRLKANEIYCESHAVAVNVSGKNFSPLQIILRSELAACENVTSFQKDSNTDGFHKWCPTKSKSEVAKEIPFAGICGKDSMCVSDLRLSCLVPEFLTGAYVLDSSEYFRLFLRVVNVAEPALEAKLRISSNIDLIHNEEKYETQRESPKKIFWQIINGYISEHYETNYSFAIPVKEIARLHLREPEKKLILTAQIQTSSLKKYENTDDKCTVAVKLVSDASLVLHSTSSLTKLYASEKTSEDRVKVVHYYEVEKKGHSPVLEVELIVRVPSRVGTDLVPFHVETSDWMQVLRVSRTVNATGKISGRLYNITSEKFYQGLNDEGKVLFINCSHKEKDECHDIKIVFNSGVPSGPSSWVKIILQFNISSFDSVRGENDVILYGTSAFLKYQDVFGGPDANREIRSELSLQVFPAKKGKLIEKYVIALSVLAGGFIVFLIVSWLEKKKFFKRVKKEELDALKHAEACFVYFSNKPGAG